MVQIGDVYVSTGHENVLKGIRFRVIDIYGWKSGNVVLKSTVGVIAGVGQVVTSRNNLKKYWKHVD
jgi:hypothetical protein